MIIVESFGECRPQSIISTIESCYQRQQTSWTTISKEAKSIKITINSGINIIFKSQSINVPATWLRILIESNGTIEAPAS